jgi:hypothetical protein
MGTVVLNGAGSGSTTLTPVDAVTAVITLPSATSTLATLGTPSFTTGIGVGAATAGAGGVAFPATAVAVANVNTLDDYDEYTAPSAACTGAVTVSVVWKLVKVGKVVTLLLPATLSAGVATSSFVYGELIPAKYRPPTPDAVDFVVRVFDNGSAQTQPGLIEINATTGSITGYKTPVGTTNFTVTATAGVPALGLSWLTA